MGLVQLISAEEAWKAQSSFTMKRDALARRPSFGGYRKPEELHDCEFQPQPSSSLANFVRLSNRPKDRVRKERSCLCHSSRPHVLGVKTVVPGLLLSKLEMQNPITVPAFQTSLRTCRRSIKSELGLYGESDLHIRHRRGLSLCRSPR